MTSDGIPRWRMFTGVALFAFWSSGLDGWIRWIRMQDTLLSTCRLGYLDADVVYVGNAQTSAISINIADADSTTDRPAGHTTSTLPQPPKT